MSVEYSFTAITPQYDADWYYLLGVASIDQTYLFKENTITNV